MRDEVERFIQMGEESHGDSLRFWLGMDDLNEVVAEFIKYLQSRKDRVT